MHGQEHSGLHLLPLQARMDFDHGQLHEVRGSSLDGSVHGFALSTFTGGLIPAMDLGDGTQSAEKGPYAAGGSRFVDQAVKRLLHLIVAAEIRVNVLLRLGFAGAGASSQAEGAESVNHAVVD